MSKNERNSEIRRLYKQGMPVKEIAERYNMDPRSVWGHLKKTGVLNYVMKRWTEEEIAVIAEARRQHKGKFTRDVAKQLGRGYEAVRGKVHRLIKEGKLEK